MFKHPDFFRPVKIRTPLLVPYEGLGVKLAVPIKKLVRRYLKVQEPEKDSSIPISLHGG